MIKKGLTYLKIIVGFLLIFFISKRIGVPNIIDALLKINTIYILLILIVYFVSLVIGSYNVKMLLNHKYKNIRFSSFFKHFFTSNSIGLFLPGKIGDFSISYFLNREHNVKASHSFSAVLIDKLLTLIFVILVALIGILFLFEDLIQDYLIILGIIALAILGILVLIIFGKKLIKIMLGDYYKYYDEISDFFKEILKSQKKILLLNILLTTLRSIILTLVFYLSFMAFGLNIDFIKLFLINSIVIFISLIPISISGLGIREGSAVFFFNKFNIPSAITFNAFILVTIITYIIAVINLIIYNPKMKYKEVKGLTEAKNTSQL